MPRTTIVWFLQDLRLADNPALAHAARNSAVVVPLFLWTPGEYGEWAPGPAARAWLGTSLSRLDADLRRRGSRLIMRAAPSALEALRGVAREVAADAVVWNARYEPALRRRDRDAATALKQDGLEVRVFRGRLLHDPRRIRTVAGAPYQVFSAFWRRLQQEVVVGEDSGRPRLGERRAPVRWPASVSPGELGLLDGNTGLPRIGRSRGSERAGIPAMVPGEAAAQQRMAAFVAEDLVDYPAERNRLDRNCTSRLSPHLAHGELSPRQVWNAVVRSVSDDVSRRAADAYLRQLAWREFAYHLLFHFPHTAERPLREEFRAFPWRSAPGPFLAWQEGRTGYPVVDAAMRQLRASGWMHNRGRMIVASFLTKHLLVPWQDGARWFWESLVDADLANNTLGWQWTAGCGADAQPFYRIFNPISQGMKFDPAGRYVRAWVPELADVGDEWIHRPWQAIQGELSGAGHRAAAGYPGPVVDHGQARTRALAAYAGL